MTLTSRVNAAGPALVLGYCVINSVKSVYEGALVQHLAPEFIAFNCFVLAQVFYLAVCRDKRSLATAVRRSMRDVVAYNISTAVSWVAVLYAFTAFEPVIANSIILGLVPSLTIMMGPLLRPDVRVVLLEKIAAGIMVATMTYLLLAAENGSSAIGALPPAKFTIGVVSCVLTAAAVAGNTFFAKRLSEAGMAPRQIMASRFAVLIAVALATLLWRDTFSPYSQRTILAMLAISVIGVIVSLYLLQQGIVRTEPITVSLLFGVNLVITYVVQFLDPRLHQTAATFVGICVLSAAICLGAWARRSRLS